MTPEVIDLAGTLPSDYKNLGGEAKPVLKMVGARYYPREWMDAPKLGFPTPTIAWLKGPLRSWMKERTGPTSWGRAMFGDQTIDELTPDRDFELLWTLASMEEFLSLAFPDREGREVPVLSE